MLYSSKQLFLFLPFKLKSNKLQVRCKGLCVRLVNQPSFIKALQEHILLLLLKNSFLYINVIAIAKIKRKILECTFQCLTVSLHIQPSRNVSFVNWVLGNSSTLTWFYGIFFKNLPPSTSLQFQQFFLRLEFHTKFISFICELEYFINIINFF